MGILSTLIGAVSTGGASLWLKFAPYVIGFALFSAVVGGFVFYVHEKDAALAKAEAALSVAQGKLAAALQANSTDEATIQTLRSDQLASQAAEASMNVRDEITAKNAAMMEAIIERDTGCAELPTVEVSGAAKKASNKTVTISGKDGPVSAVLADTLTALAGAMQKAAP